MGFDVNRVNGAALQMPAVMQETILLHMSIWQDDQETVEHQGRRQESHQNSAKTWADSFNGSAGIQHPRSDRTTKGQTHTTKVQIRYVICGSILRLHLCLPAKTTHQQRNSDGEARFQKLRLTEFCEPIQGHSHLEMPGILVQLGRIQRT